MRFCAFRLLLVLALPIGEVLHAEEAVSRVGPAPTVQFRGVALSRDMNLREPAPTTVIVRPNPPLPTTPIAVTTKGPTVNLPTARPAAESPARKPTSPAITKAAPPTTPPLRSALPPRTETPASALPPGGRELALQPTTFTPYDRYLGSVRAVTSNLEIHDCDMALTARLMKEGHRFKYRISDPYRADSPAQTEARQAGDCKSKALWLYDNLGDVNALFVIGKAQKRARNSHAWVYWRNDDRWWILDCTERSDPIAADSVSADRYVPYYSFGKGGAYRHKATRLILTGGLSTNPKPVATLR